MVNVSGSRSAVADAQRDMPRETQLDEEKIGMEEDVRLKPNTITHPLRRRLLKIAFTSTIAVPQEPMTAGHSDICVAIQRGALLAPHMDIRGLASPSLSS
jgi:hypothetical protein